MLSKRISWILLITVMLITSATATQAQSTGQPGESVEQQETQTAGQGGGIPEVLIVGQPKTAIVGTWLGTLLSTGSKSLITFNADGTLINSMQGESSTNPARPPHTSHHGVWHHLGGRLFGLTMWDIFYDINTGQLVQYTKIRMELTLDSPDEMSASGKVEFLNPQGDVLLSRSGSFTHKRIKFEPFN